MCYIFFFTEKEIEGEYRMRKNSEKIKPEKKNLKKERKNLNKDCSRCTVCVHRFDHLIVSRCDEFFLKKNRNSHNDENKN